MAKKKYYLTLDTETATLPFADEICRNPKQKQQVAIAKPLVYDIGWCITDRQGNIVKKENFLVQETFFVPNIFNTAYYCNKRPFYMEMLEKGEICGKCWNEIADILLEDLHAVDIAVAYNAAFDFKKAIPFTENYIRNLYSANYNEWEKRQKYSCENIAKGITRDKTNPKFLNPVFEFRGEKFPIADLWGVTCNKLININRYKNYCLQNNLLTASAQYFQSSAQTAYQYIMGNYDFEEDHTALSDALIEAEILTKALKRGAVLPEMEAFPFRNLGTTVDYVETKMPKYAEIVLDALTDYLASYEGSVRYAKKVNSLIDRVDTVKKEYERDQEEKKNKKRKKK